MQRMCVIRAVQGCHLGQSSQRPLQVKKPHPTGNLGSGLFHEQATPIQEATAQGEPPPLRVRQWHRLQQGIPETNRQEVRAPHRADATTSFQSPGTRRPIVSRGPRRLITSRSRNKTAGNHGQRSGRNPASVHLGPLAGDCDLSTCDQGKPDWASSVRLSRSMRR